MNDWVNHLQQILIREAIKTSEKTTMTRSQFVVYVNELTQIKDWPDEFLEEAYHSYVEKINETGRQLTDKVSSKE